MCVCVCVCVSSAPNLIKRACDSFFLMPFMYGALSILMIRRMLWVCGNDYEVCGEAGDGDEGVVS